MCIGLTQSRLTWCECLIAVTVQMMCLFSCSNFNLSPRKQTTRLRTGSTLGPSLEQCLFPKVFGPILHYATPDRGCAPIVLLVLLRSKKLFSSWLHFSLFIPAILGMLIMNICVSASCKKK